MIDLYAEFLKTVQWLRNRGHKVDLDLLVALDEHDLTPDEKKRFADGVKSKLIPSRNIKAVGDGYVVTRSEMWGIIFDSIFEYLNDDGLGFTTYKDRIVLAISEAYLATSEIAYIDGGGTLPLDEDAISVGRSEIAAQLAYVDQLFINLRQMKKEDDFDPIAEAFGRANGYARSLDMFYNIIKTMAGKNKMLTFGGPDGKESCGDCKKYKGQRHRASWWISRDAVPPSRSFECKGYHCEHKLSDDSGKVWTI